MLLHGKQTTVMLIVLAAALTACGGFGGGGELPSVESEQPGAPADLDGTERVLTSLNGASLVEGSNITPSFTEGRVAGFAGCNAYSAAYTFAGSFLAFETPVATEMACLNPAGAMEQEQRYLDFLRGVTAYSVDGGQLRLKTGDGRALVFTVQQCIANIERRESSHNPAASAFV